MDIKLEYTLHKAAAGDSPGRYRITKRQIAIAEDWKSDPGRTPWSAESRKRLTVDDGRRLSHDLRSVTVTSGKRPAQHWMAAPPGAAEFQQNGNESFATWLMMTTF